MFELGKVGGQRFGCTLRRSPSRPGISPHRHRLGVPNHIVQVGDGALELPAVDGLGGFTCVLEGNAEVGAAGAGGFRGLEVRGCVSDLKKRRRVLVWGSRRRWRVSGSASRGMKRASDGNMSVVAGPGKWKKQDQEQLDERLLTISTEDWRWSLLFLLFRPVEAHDDGGSKFAKRVWAYRIGNSCPGGNSELQSKLDLVKKTTKFAGAPINQQRLSRSSKLLSSICTSSPVYFAGFGSSLQFLDKEAS